MDMFCIFFLFTYVVNARPYTNVFNVLKYGVVADGKTDCSKAFWTAWTDACAWNGGGTVLIPKGNYLVGPATFKGPCKGPIDFQIQGVVNAPSDWIMFQYVNGLYVGGGGTFHCHVQLHYNHTAPEDSPNTDGIHIGDSSFISISHSNIGTGDDYISFGAGSNNIHVSNVTCGPGHGISVGSLGKIPKTPLKVLMKDVHYRNIWGTSSSKVAVNFVCSRSLPCQKIEVKDIYLPYNGNDGQASANCLNVRGYTVGKQLPKIRL
ncbi:hypothetical protein AQUCO_02800199v1 [Aquilegia coerulea]|uniref:Uncharacterized protein n=1 Tax=Aquilegia coerulea TaxID=218851 RepID=A0A2G5D4A6_AQUCA|nr:hypothetical protein AQUCO_02800199v1 [Aquilegia coerulea]